MISENKYANYLSESQWLVYESAYDINLQILQESLFSLGNGYMGSRGIYEELTKYTNAGTFFAGIYEDSISNIAEIINAPNPFHISASILKTEKLDISMMPYEHHERILDLRKGLLVRKTVYRTPTNHSYDYESIRFVSQHNLHVAGMQIRMTPLTNGTHFLIDCTIDISVKNRGIILEQDTQNFQILNSEKQDDTVFLAVESLDLKKEIAYGQRIILEVDGIRQKVFGTCFNLYLEPGQTAVITKIITFYTARDRASRTKLRQKTMRSLNRACEKGFKYLLEEHISAFEKRWQHADIQIVGDPEALSALRFNIYHALISAHSKVKDVSIGAKMLTGQGYNGHVFWETELLMLPFFLLSDPKLARCLLEYRFNRLEAAKQIAAARGYKGALYPWESADSGKDETPSWFEGLDESIDIVHTGKTALHINVAIFYAIHLYFSATFDIEFMIEMGLPMIIEMARFWKSRVVHNKKRNIYKIKHVMGPDEFHFNVDNNAYTNKLVAWSLNKTLDYIKQLEIQFPSEVSQKLDELKFNLQERARLAKIAKGIWIPMHDKIVLEFENFLSLEYYRLPSLNIFGLPTLPSFLLVAELYKTQYIKQGDVVLLLLLLPQCFDLKTAQANYHFYAARSLQKSSWGPPITSAVAAQIENTVKAYQYFQVTLNTDKKNIFENTDKGMHTPAVGGSWIAMMYGFCGIRILDDRVLITPNLPELWQSVTTQFCYLDFVVKLMITKMQIRIRLDKSDNAWLLRQTLRKPTNAINVQIGKSVKQLLPNQEYLFALESPSSCFDTNANSG